MFKRNFHSKNDKQKGYFNRIFRREIDDELKRRTFARSMLKTLMFVKMEKKRTIAGFFEKLERSLETLKHDCISLSK